MENAAEFANFEIARLLSEEALRGRIADRVWGAFIGGEYDAAAFQAMKTVEVSIRSACRFGNDMMAQNLCGQLFTPTLDHLQTKRRNIVNVKDAWNGSVALTPVTRIPAHTWIWIVAGERD